MNKLSNKIKKKIRKKANPEKAEFQKRYFKTGPNDVFLGLTIPILKK